MNDSAKRYGKCPDCGSYAVHLATREIVEFSGDQDDNLNETSGYSSEFLELRYGVTLFIHACFECGYLENVGIEWPRKKVVDTREYQWTSEWPTEPGMYWFYGRAFIFGELKGKPERLSVEVALGQGGHPICIGNGNFMYKDDCRGVWTPASVPDAPIDQLEEML